MPTAADDIINEALIEIGVVDLLDDMYSGSRAAKVGRQVYDSMLRGMFAAAPWNFARRQRQIDMMGDASGQFHANTYVPLPWRFMYEWPTDCVHARYVMALNAYALDENGVAVYSPPAWNRPAPFLVTDVPIPNDFASNWDQVEGHSPESTRAICTNQLGAQLIYTGLIQYPDAWDPLFRRAMVAAMAARIVLPMMDDKRTARAIRDDQIRIAREAMIEARVRDGNEGWTVVDHTPDWIRARTSSIRTIDWCGSGWDTSSEDAGGVY
jgi:hypothetical protein